MENLQNGLPDLDELDMTLIRELDKDARVSNLSLARRLGAANSTVRRRLNRLIDLGVITIATTPAYRALGYTTVLILAVNAPPGTLNTLTRQLASANSIKYIWITTGRYDLVALAFYRNPEEYIRLFPEEIGTIPGNVRIQPMLLVKSSWSHLTDNDADVADSHLCFTLTELDIAIIKRLEKTPRASAKELAKDIGISISSVRTRLRKLTTQGIIRVRCIRTPAAFGYPLNGITLIQVQPSSLKTLSDDLNVYTSVNEITLTLGEFNCIVWTSFQNIEQMSDFLVEDLGNMPGVEHFENLIILKVPKGDSVRRDHSV